MRTALPWPRGQVSNDHGVVSVDDTTHAEYEGLEFEVPDTEHGFGQPVVLRAVKNDTGSDITVARKCYTFSTAGQGDYGGRVSGLAGAGEVGYPIDDAYAVGSTIPDDALFYIVVKGRCDVLTTSTNNNYATGINVSIASGGVLNDAAAVAAGAFVLGTLDYESAYAANTAVLVNVGNVNAVPPAAG